MMYLLGLGAACAAGLYAIFLHVRIRAIENIFRQHESRQKPSGKSFTAVYKGRLYLIEDLGSQTERLVRIRERLNLLRQGPDIFE